jgi:hypothetical protein
MSGKWYANPAIIIGAFVSLAALLFAAVMLLLLPQSPEILRFMQRRMSKAATFKVSVVADYEGWRESKAAGGQKSREVVRVRATGPVDRGDIEPKLQQDITVTVGEGGGAVSVMGQYIRAGKDYVRFSLLPSALGSLDIGRYRNKWLSFDLDSLRARLAMPVFGGVGKKMSAEDLAYLEDQFRRTPFLTFIGKLKSEKIGGISCFHYRVLPEPLLIKDYLVTAEEARLARELTEAERSAMDKFFADVEPDESEVWIGKGDYYLYRARFRFRHDDGVRKGTLSLTANFSDFNRPVSIAAPSEQSEEMGGVLKALLPGLTGKLTVSSASESGQPSAGGDTGKSGLPSTATGIAATGDTDGDGLTDDLERFFVTDARDPDTDDDGLTDGYEVDNGLNPKGAGALFDFGITERLNR